MHRADCWPVFLLGMSFELVVVVYQFTHARTPDVVNIPSVSDAMAESMSMYGASCRS